MKIKREKKKESENDQELNIDFSLREFWFLSIFFSQG